MLNKTPSILRAIDFATNAHGTQLRRYSGRAYIEHPIAVARLVARFEHDEDMLMAAVLHDTVEDTPVTLNEVEQEFGREVAALVSDLTDVSKPDDGNRKTRKAIDLEHSWSASPRAKTVKLMDLVHNTGSIVRHDKSFATVYLREKELLLEALKDASDPPAWHLASAVYIRALDRIRNFFRERGSTENGSTKDGSK
jgi:(p)ppGpp synthase/HD superfamily hydrolase